MSTYHDDPRTKNMTVLMPEGMFEDLRALRMATGQSSNDLINELIAAHLSSCGPALEVGREMLRIRAEGMGRKAAREIEASKPEPSGDAAEFPSDKFIEVWASAEGKPGKALRFSKEYVDWCRDNGKPFMTSAKEFRAEVLEKRFTESSADTYRRMIDRLIKEWAMRPRLS